MPITRADLTAADLKFFTRFARWQAPAVRPNIIRDLLSAEEIVLKREHYPELLAKALATAEQPLDLSLDWDALHEHVFGKMNSASLYYLFTGDARMISHAVAALEAFEACERPYFTYSTCIGVLDMDLRTAHVAHCLALMKCCFGEALAPEIHRRMADLVVTRILAPGLEAERTARYPWMVSDANWRIILCGGFAIAGMAFADDFPEYRALIDYGVEAMLVCAATGDKAGSWNEGPGYWEYGFSTGVAFMHALRLFTGGAVNLFRHPFYRATGDFRVFMQARPGVNWNWSDCGKAAGPSTTLTAFARGTRDTLHQHAVEAQGITSLGQLYWYDPSLPAMPPGPDDHTRYFPSVGVLTWRTGFADTDTFVGVKAGDLKHYNHHCHLDMGTVVVHAAGRELLAELDHWPYPHEGIKDPSKKGYQPGFYDIDNQRWMTQDFDVRLAEGHNGVMLDDGLPEFRLGVTARFLRRIDEPRLQAAIVDSTPYYTPLATRVRRYVAFLPPDVLLIVDDIRATRPVRARLLFHYPMSQPKRAGNLGPQTTATENADIAYTEDAFTIVNGPAELRARLLCPSATDHLIIGHNERRTTYLPPSGLLTQLNKYLYVENLYRKPRLGFVAALQFGPAGFTPVEFALEGNPMTNEQFRVVIERAGEQVAVEFDLVKRMITRE